MSWAMKTALNKANKQVSALKIELKQTKIALKHKIKLLKTANECITMLEEQLTDMIL